MQCTTVLLHPAVIYNSQSYIILATIHIIHIIHVHNYSLLAATSKLGTVIPGYLLPNNMIKHPSLSAPVSAPRYPRDRDQLRRPLARYLEQERRERGAREERPQEKRKPFFAEPTVFAEGVCVHVIRV